MATTKKPAKNSENSESFDIKKDFSDRFIAKLDEGKVPWKKGWVCTGNPNDLAFNRVANKTAEKIAAYSMTNQVYLYLQFGENFAGEWASFKQWQAEGYYVKKGEKGSKILFYKPHPIPKKDESGNPVKDKDGKTVMITIPLLKYSCVFHYTQVEDKDGNSPTPYHKTDEIVLPSVAESGSMAESLLMEYLNRQNIRLHFGGDSAYYAPASDSITLPDRDKFLSTLAFIQTFAHESGHSTGHKSRLNLLDNASGFGSDKYGREELRAEMISAWFCNAVGLEPEIDGNHIAYCQAWSKAVKNLSKHLITIISGAEKGLKLMLGISDQLANEGGEDENG